jgi:hypothetical protein
MLRHVSGRKGIYYFDTVSEFDAAGRSGMFVDFIHYSERGNKVVADKPLEILVRLGYVTRQESVARLHATP